MKRLFLVLVAGGLVGGAVAFSRPGRPAAEFVFKSEERNPVTHLKLNNDPDEFRFAIVSDRTGSHRAQVFSQAVARLNLLRPHFVVSVGDLIEGGNKPQKKIDAEWAEFDGYVKQLAMPFFYVPGNHDVGHKKTDKVWRERYGRRNYHFSYRNVFFLVLNTDDPPGSGAGHLGAEQVAWVKDVLKANRAARWTVVLLHKPVWTSAKVATSGWPEVEAALAARPYTVFCGHVHRYHKYVRQGRNYYQLATTGGGSRMRGVRYGEFDHIAWVTMKKDGPVIANVLLGSVLPDDLKVPPTDEKGVSTKSRKPTQPVRGTLYVDGSPAAGAIVQLWPVLGKEKARYSAQAMTEADGSFTVSSYTAFDGAPAGEYRISVTWPRPLVDASGKPGRNVLPAKYASPETSGLTRTVVAGENVLDLRLRGE
jgi:hypothetical protein